MSAFSWKIEISAKILVRLLIKALTDLYIENTRLFIEKTAGMRKNCNG